MSKKWEVRTLPNSRQHELNNLLKLAEEGDAFSQNMLAARLATGYFIEQNMDGAFYWYCQAIKQGYTHSKWNAGTMILAGEVNMDIGMQIGLRLIRDAAEAYENSACLFISDCYLYGDRGFEKNLDKSLDWEQKAMEFDKFREFSQPIDLENEYFIVIKKPNINAKGKDNQ
jgi:TPR repeat protein